MSLFNMLISFVFLTAIATASYHSEPFPEVENWTLVKATTKSYTFGGNQDDSRSYTYSNISTTFHRTSPGFFSVNTSINANSEQPILISFSMRIPQYSDEIITSFVQSSPPVSDISDLKLRSVVSYIYNFYQSAYQWEAEKKNGVYRLALTGTAGRLWFATREGACDMAVSLGGPYDNQHCAVSCNEASPDFLFLCAFEDYEIDSSQQVVTLKGTTSGYGQSLGQCFSNWVPGYTDESFYGTSSNSNAGRLITAESPQLCQNECQADSTCFYFSWRAIVNEGTTSQQKNACLLKTKQMFIDALADKLDVTVNSPYCPAAVKSLCSSKSGRCLSCDGKPTCLLRSTAVVSGPKFCDGDFSNDGTCKLK